MAERYYTFLVANRVENSAVFAEQNDELAQLICVEQNYDQAIWLGEAQAPPRWATYDGEIFTPPTEEYLISIGVLEKDATNG
jgi:hypothetical protein